MNEGDASGSAAGTRPHSPLRSLARQGIRLSVLLRRLTEPLAGVDVLPVGHQRRPVTTSWAIEVERPRLAAARVGDGHGRLVGRRGRDLLRGEAEKVASAERSPAPLASAVMRKASAADLLIALRVVRVEQVERAVRRRCAAVVPGELVARGEEGGDDLRIRRGREERRRSARPLR